MANRKFLLGILVIALVFGMTVIGCEEESEPPPPPPPQPGDTVDDPIGRIESIDLGDMTSEDSGWKQLLDSIGSAKKYINLDLSACTMTGTSIGPLPSEYGSTTYVGKQYIVSLILPNAATSIVADASNNGAFGGFTSLKSISGANITTIGDYALKQSSLETVTFPNVTSIGFRVFFGCRKLTTLYIPKVTSIGGSSGESCVFEMTGDTAALTITMGPTAPTLGTSSFANAGGTKTVKVKVPSGATGYSPFTGTSVTVSGTDTTANWANGFRGGGWDGSTWATTFGGVSQINQNISLTIEQQ